MSNAETQLSGGLSLDVFDPVPVGIAVTSGPGHRLVYTNHAYQEIVGERTRSLPGREVFSDLRPLGFVAQLDQVLETGQTITLREVPFEFRDSGPPWRERYASASMSRISLASGEVGVLIIIAEVTDHVGPEAEFGAVRSSRAILRYQSLLQIDTQALWVGDGLGRITEPSPGWQRLSGQTFEEYRGNGWLAVIHPDDRELSEEAAYQAMLRQSHLEQIYRLAMPDGTYRHIRSRAAPVIENGEVVEWIGALADIEDEWQESRLRTLLDQTAAATADVADLEEVLGMLSKVIVPTLADGVGIYLLPQFEDDQSIVQPFIAERVVTTNRDGMPPSRMLRTERFEPDSVFADVIRRRRPVRFAFPCGSPPADVVPTGAEEWFATARVNSMALVPVLVDGTVAAIVDATVSGCREPISTADVDLLSRMLEHAHAHLSNAMRFQRTQRVALALQHYLLPEPPELPGLEITARYRPSASTAEIGGDWYDSFLHPDGSAILTIGDVAGHDLGAAVTMSQLRNMLRGLAMDRREPPGDILRRLNIATEVFHREGTASCILARLENRDDGEWLVNYSLAGHPPPLLVTSDGDADYLDGGRNPLLGVGYDAPRQSAVTSLPPGSTLLLYTDGLVEVPGEDIDMGLERLRRHSAALSRVSLDVFCDELLARMPVAKQDDIAMIAVRLPRAVSHPAG
ncbi:SpoIIE family protein phosphatase [Nonomuraea jiangxiensis]|uniref:PAS domain S-box-containing protein n=1 Tax=Nonomuraea jiangxiensis TaxID=633440 RepID=A0A1G8J8E3_9ACTN|nr:SpoIIE family protein phosphatase [Nonomuraea jiangxiensis]SDI27456.1 PAS domain S-box-containing protein [Nonomuraea jiangxiensis]